MDLGYGITNVESMVSSLPALITMLLCLDFVLLIARCTLKITASLCMSLIVLLRFGAMVTLLLVMYLLTVAVTSPATF